METGTDNRGPAAHVSVVMPAFNASQTIRSALDSVRAQTFENYEVIVVDDASTDDTADIVSSEYAGLPNWRLIRAETNGGPARARNMGIADASGEWIAFVDADDVCLPHRLEDQLNGAARHPAAAMLVGKAVAMDYDEENGNAVTHADAPDRRLALTDLAADNPVTTSTVMLKRKTIEDLGGFDEQFCGPEDYDLWLRVASSEVIVYIDAPASKYAQVSGSLSTDDRTFLPQVLAVLDKAYGEGGVLHDLAHLRNASMSTQFWNASWMAFNRGARALALLLWTRSWILSLRAPKAVARPRSKLLFRYLFGRREESRSDDRP
jgi:glycosyltransferase involved in cell wall biosynthesis